MKQLIVTADDFGYSKERNKGIVESYLNGIVTTTSLMVNALHSEDAVSLAKESGIPFKNIEFDLVLKRKRPGVPFRVHSTDYNFYHKGLHFNITEGNPLSHKSEVGSLLDKDGYFLGKAGFNETVQQGLINGREVKIEMRRQIERFKQLTGQYPLYIDGHQHVHVTGIRESYSQVLQEYGIQFTRQCAELNMDKMDHLTAGSNNFLSLKSKEAEISKPVYQKYGIWSPDRFVGLSTMGSNMTLERLQSIITTAFTESNRGSNCVCELMVHPGYRTIDEGGCGNGPDDFSQSRDREHELEILTGSGMEMFLKENDIELISYCDVDLN